MRLIACICFLSFASLAFGQATVRLMTTTTVQGPYVELGEIAKIDANDPGIKQKLMTLVVGDSPKIGASRLFSSYMIRSLITQQGLTAEVCGSQTQVTTEGRVVNASEIEFAIHAWVDNHVNPSYEAQVEIQSISQEWMIPVGDKVTIVAYSSTKQFSNPINMDLRAVCDSKVLSNSHARVKISLFAQAPVVINPIRKGEIISYNHVRMQRADVSQTTGMEVAALEQVIGMEARRDLRMDSLISANDVTSPVLIEKGSLNRLLVINGNVYLKLSGAEALQSGRKGDVISFKNPLNTAETLRGKVVKEGSAVIKIR